MEFRQLRYFLAVAEELHFGRAATRLDMAQPPLSRQIASLEESLGVQLFDRSRSQIRLTQAGVVLQDHARQILDRMDTAQRETRLVGAGGAGRLRIAFVGSASHGLLPMLIKWDCQDFRVRRTRGSPHRLHPQRLASHREHRASQPLSPHRP
ncbi:LysR family transcriptional regulator [Sphingobium sp. DC-2]|uniref:LysR family transcriptional regulator n=1 Tax=Sphingobium sp. DC-2 TaxID=1303256 RepID=UPI000AAD05C7|nr:LysR family transcriptional regulator [Sphingobium sp. DC-2]